MAKLDAALPLVASDDATSFEGLRVAMQVTRAGITFSGVQAETLGSLGTLLTRIELPKADSELLKVA